MSTPQVRFETGNAHTATTWVCKAPECNLPYFQDALTRAVDQGMHVGLHGASRSVVIHFDSPQPAQRVARKLETLIGRGAGAKVAIQSMEALDLFHAEQWGLVQPMGPPKLPHVPSEDDVDDDHEIEVSEDMADSTETVFDFPTDDVPLDGGISRPDLFALVPNASSSMVVPGVLKTLEMETGAERRIRDIMTTDDVSLTPYLEELLFKKGVGHTKEVQHEARSSGLELQVKVIVHWITTAPTFITVHIRSNMALKRRVEWIKWKAQIADMELTLPMFMAFLKQTTSSDDIGSRLLLFKRAVEQWRGKSLDWRALSTDEKNLIQNINSGKFDCYCLHCKRVLKPASKVQFCSNYCASLYCQCGEKLRVRRVRDHGYVVTGLNDDALMELLEMKLIAHIRPEVDMYLRGEVDMYEAYQKLRQQSHERQCCNGMMCVISKDTCKPCFAAWNRMNKIQTYVHKLRSGQLSWHHIEKADAVLIQNAKDMEPRMMDERYCKDCQDLEDLMKREGIDELVTIASTKPSDVGHVHKKRRY